MNGFQRNFIRRKSFEYSEMTWFRLHAAVCCLWWTKSQADAAQIEPDSPFCGTKGPKTAADARRRRPAGRARGRRTGRRAISDWPLSNLLTLSALNDPFTWRHSWPVEHKRRVHSFQLKAFFK